MSGFKNKLITDGSVQELGSIANVAFALTTVRACNPTSADINLTIWVTSNAMPSQVDLIEPSVVIEPDGRYEALGLTMSAGEFVFVKSSTSGLVMRMETVDET